jgi:phosphoribosyl-AMP cyclohydrolase
MTTPSPRFAPRGGDDAVETGTALSPRFDRDGLIVAIAADAATGDVLMVAYMNEEALARTIETRRAWFWSRSRGELWQKGETSGNTMTVEDVRIDCDQDAVLVKVRVAGDGVACHRGYRSCFFRSAPLGAPPTADLTLAFDAAMPRRP